MDPRRPDPRRTDLRRADARQYPPRKKKRRRKSTFEQLKPVLVCLAVVALFVLWRMNASQTERPRETEPSEPPIQSQITEDDDSLEKFAAENGLSMSEWPDNLVELYNNNPDAREFVRNYPRDKDKHFDTDLSGVEQAREVPLLFQWDQRWGYTKYGDDLLALTGCGPTCLSMVCIYLLKDAAYTPRYVADFSDSRGYFVPGAGTSWTLISQGGVDLGLNVTELPLVEQRIMDNLEEGNPIICAMAPGIFTKVGHYIVLVGCEDGKIRVNDPNSIIRSRQLWDFDEIQDQISNLWVCTVD